jgi:hypothetical protein
MTQLDTGNDILRKIKDVYTDTHYSEILEYKR